MSCVSGRAELSGGGEGVVSGFRRVVRRWGVVGVVVCLLVVAFSVGGSSLPELPSYVAESVVEAAEVCGGEETWESGCAESAWAACGAAQRYWEGEGHIFYAYNNLPDYDRAKFLPREFLCRGAHMAELAELAVVLAGRYGDAFYEEETGITQEGEAIFGDFWEFRERMAYTPWFPAEIYTLNDNGPPRLIAPRYSGTHFRIGRWLEKVQEWGDWDKPSRAEAERQTDIVVDWFDPRIAEMSESTVALLDLFLGSISDRTKSYDSWPPEANLDPRTGERGGMGVSIFWAITKENYYNFTYAGGEFGVSEPGSEVIEVCLDAAFSARLGRLAWQREIDMCSEAGISCIESAYGGDLRCAAVADLAELERQWQMLPRVCASVDDSNNVADVCLEAALSICHHDKDFFTYLQYVPYRRVVEITYAACSLAETIRDGSLPPWSCSNLIDSIASVTRNPYRIDLIRHRQDRYIKRMEECQTKYDCFTPDNIYFICSELSTAEQGLSKLLAQNTQ